MASFFFLVTTDIWHLSSSYIWPSFCLIRCPCSYLMGADIILSGGPVIKDGAWQVRLKSVFIRLVEFVV